uniref:Receptor L-domain domain-containing protein n=1 Tax=Timema cristinae TaxID=61476 RepID=A0A7R9CD63_TIMCR|nr:unnamed protein product [Timema cristinae]
MCLAAVTFDSQNLDIYLNFDCHKSAVSCQSAPKKPWGYLSLLCLAVCQSVDVRNDVQAFQRLSGCRVVEGFVQILLIDRADETAYDNVTFPELREITDYLLLYRVNGLRSVGKLFPNLAVIRGNTLLFNYAFISFEMIHLQVRGWRCKLARYSRSNIISCLPVS